MFTPFRHQSPQEKSVPILLYHKITSEFGMGGVWNTPRQFRAQMEHLKSMGFEAVSPGKAFEDFQERTVVITFDDGYEGVYEHAFPVLKELGFTASIFLITGYVGRSNEWDVNFGVKFRHLNWSQIEEMAGEGISFHSHTHTHPNLTWLGDSELRDELTRSKMELEEKLGRPARYLSYPFGIYDARVKETAQEVGYEGCFSSYRGRRGRKDRYAMRRHGIYIIDTLWDLRAKIAGRDGISIRFEELKGKTINFFAKGTYVVKRLQGARGELHPVSEYD